MNNELTKEDIKKMQEELDYRRLELMPGLIDPHSHIAGMAPMFADLCDLSKCENMEQIVDAMKAYLAERQIPAGQPVVGVNYDDNFLAEQRHPDRKLLDTISTEHPVILLHISVHMVVGNTMALQVCNYTNEKEFPGGEVGRYEDGTMNGYLAETASYDMIGYVMFGMQSQMAKVWGAAQKLYLSHGVTTAQEGSSSLDLVKMLMGFDKACDFWRENSGLFDIFLITDDGSMWASEGLRGMCRSATGDDINFVA